MSSEFSEDTEYSDLDTSYSGEYSESDPSGCDSDSNTSCSSEYSECDAYLCIDERTGDLVMCEFTDEYSDDGCSKFYEYSELKGSYTLCLDVVTGDPTLYEYGFGKDMLVSKFNPGFNISYLDYYYHLAIVANTGQLYSTWHNSESLKKMKGFSNVTKVSCGREHILVLTDDHHIYEINHYGKNKIDWKLSLINGEDPVDICASANYSVVLGSESNIYVFQNRKIDLFHKAGNHIKSISCMFYDDFLHTLQIYAIDKKSGFYKFTRVENKHGKAHLATKNYLPKDKIESIKCGNDHVVNLTKSNAVYTAGVCRGQLGTPGNFDEFPREQHIPQLIHLTDSVVYDIIAKGDYSLVITNKGTYGFGSNIYNQLGTDCDPTVVTPKKIKEFKNKIFYM